MGMTLLVMLIRHDHALPVRGVRLIVSSLVHDSLAVRKVPLLLGRGRGYEPGPSPLQLALKAVAYLLLQHKRPHLKEAVDIEKEGVCVCAVVSGCDTIPPVPSAGCALSYNTPGEREDTKWCDQFLPSPISPPPSPLLQALLPARVSPLI